MPLELRLLVYSVALLFVLVAVQATAGVMAQGLMPMAGNRDALGEPKPFQARTKRLVDNHREGLILFAPLILTAALLHVSTGTTELGARMSFYSRVAHAAIYLLGLPLVRPLFWGIGMAGTVMIFLALFQIA